MEKMSMKHLANSKKNRLEYVIIMISNLVFVRGTSTNYKLGQHNDYRMKQ